jgi:hypothetical protein
MDDKIKAVLDAYAALDEPPWLEPNRKLVELYDRLNHLRDWYAKQTASESSGG